MYYTAAVPKIALELVLGHAGLAVLPRQSAASILDVRDVSTKVSNVYTTQLLLHVKIKWSMNN
jgi:hypothetical protein